MAVVSAKLSQFLQSLRNVLLDMSRRLEQDVNEDLVDYVMFRMDQISQHLFRMSIDTPVFHEVQRSLAVVTSLLSEAEGNMHSATPCTSQQATGGRPKFEISMEQLQYLVDWDLTSRDIAEALGVSQSTIKRRLREYGISVKGQKTDITDADLDAAVREVQSQFPNVGYRRVHSQLLVCGIRTPQLRVRESLQRTDPDGVAMRWLSITPRAVYCVSGPLALWHIDGNHKLIR